MVKHGTGQINLVVGPHSASRRASRVNRIGGILAQIDLTVHTLEIDRLEHRFPTVDPDDLIIPGTI